MSDIAAKSKASSFSVSQIAMIGVVTAVTCVLGPMALPIGPVPISLTNLVIYFSLYVLGMRNATISYLVYLLIGLFLPVFSGGAGGDFYKNMFAKCPAGRLGTADEVANVAELLMSDKGAFITGSTFLMDGGATASYYYGPLKPEK